MDEADFRDLLAACAELGALFPDGLVFIGGIAVYLHAHNTPSVAQYAETTHDADFYVSLADMGDLRDIEEVTPNRRLSKHQLIKRGFEFDIYTERQSTLVVPFDAVVANSVRFEPFRIAGLEHLFVLKLEAYRDRRQSAKGEKDAKDLLRIAAVAAASKRGFDAAMAAPYLRDEHLALLPLVHKSPVAASMARGNAVVAKRLRASFERVTDALMAV
jgi:hypothetical protein